MAGFDRNKGRDSKVKNSSPEEDEIDFDFERDDDDDDEVDNSQSSYEYDNYERSEEVQYKRTSSPSRQVDKKSKGLIIGCLSVVGLLCMVIVILLIKNGTNKDPNNQDTQQSQGIVQTEQQEEELTAGKADLNKSNGQTINKAGLTDKEELVTDLNKNIVDKNYNVKYINTKRDYVNYKKHRSVMDKGLEVYWFDVIYLNRHYVMQVPYRYFNEMREEGIIEVDLEVLTLEDGGEIISNMQIALN